MLKRSSFYILCIFFLLSSCSTKNEREVLNVCVPENRFMLKLMGVMYHNASSKMRFEHCRMQWFVNDSVSIDKYFGYEKNGDKCHSTIRNVVYYHFIFSHEMPMTTFLMKNNFYAVNREIKADTIFKNILDKKRGYQVKSDSISRIENDTTFVFYNEDNHKFYLSYHASSRNLNWIICSEINKKNILNYKNSDEDL